MSRMMKKLTPETTISNLTGEVVFLIHEIRTKAPNSSALNLCLSTALIQNYTIILEPSTSAFVSVAEI